jgi:predicted DNA binding CopG/RHH family protein
MVSVQHSRQMGLTTMLIFHIANFLLHNTHTNKLLCLKLPKKTQGIDMINKIRYIMISCDVKFEKNNQSTIKLINGNEVRLINNINSLKLPNLQQPIDEQKDKDFVYGLIIDNAAWDDKLDTLISDFSQLSLNSMIIISGKRKEVNFFYNSIFTNFGNMFKKITVTWDQNPSRDKIWYDKIKKDFESDLDLFNCEIDLKDIPKKIINKDRIINIRLDDELMNQLSLKLIKLDISLSDYIRKLIQNDK